MLQPDLTGVSDEKQQQAQLSCWLVRKFPRFWGLWLVFSCNQNITAVASVNSAIYKGLV